MFIRTLDIMLHKGSKEDKPNNWVNLTWKCLYLTQKWVKLIFWNFSFYAFPFNKLSIKASERLLIFLRSALSRVNMWEPDKVSARASFLNITKSSRCQMCRCRKSLSTDKSNTLQALDNYAFDLGPYRMNHILALSCDMIEPEDISCALTFAAI